MSHRNGSPKTNARERTFRRWRERHDISTPQDVKHYSDLEKIKDRIKEWFNPKPKMDVLEIKSKWRSN